jgi:hypothetical protein
MSYLYLMFRAWTGNKITIYYKIWLHYIFKKYPNINTRVPTEINSLIKMGICTSWCFFTL